jgi:quinol monooxygenase YgiN
MIYARLKVVPPAERREEALRIARSLLGPTGAAPGCVHCAFYMDTQNENCLFYVEEWQSEDDLQRHIRSDDYRKFLALIDLSSEPPDLKFHRVSETFGMEYVSRARSLAR